MMDIRLNSDHDIDMTNLSMSFTDDSNGESIQQRLKIKLWSFQGEWYWNTDYGVPYFQSILGQKATSKEDVDDIFRDQITSTPGVISLLSYSSDFDSTLRAFSLDFKVLATDGPVDVSLLI